MNPSVGRIVHFIQAPGDECQAAIVVRVWTPTMVNLAAFDGNGEPFRKTSVPMLTEGGAGFSWHWPERVD